MSLHDMFADNRIFELEQRVFYLEKAIAELTMHLIKAGVLKASINNDEEETENESC